jgi:D-arabinose 1-dehydrogenase-like Zn-dependent alcohol dehydrogenase
MCAGITTYNSLRRSPVRAGDLVAVQGIGGLGHLGIQFARQMGFRTVAIGRGADKEPLAKKLGAHLYIDAGAGSPAEPLQKLGGARLIMATAPDAKSVTPLIDGLAKGGELLVLGVTPEPFSVASLAIVIPRRKVQGWPSGTAKDSEDTLQFSSMTGVRPMIEKFPLEKAAEAYDRMMSGQARFRAVLTMAA